MRSVVKILPLELSQDVEGNQQEGRGEYSTGVTLQPLRWQRSAVVEVEVLGAT